MDENGDFFMDKFLEALEDTQPEEVDEYMKCDEEEDRCAAARCMSDVNEKYNEN